MLATKVRTATLEGAALDWAVAKCEGISVVWMPMAPCGDLEIIDDMGLSFNPSTNWAQGGPIIERENITLLRANSTWDGQQNIPAWFAETDIYVGHNVVESYEGEYMAPSFIIEEASGAYGPTPLIAAMRCYVASKLGDEVETPTELL